ncbi:hypothetical protein HY249_02310 [Candidatus Azambacteria bacterium]|nr:hypothetical protein [Candidatus Azambacteria bacterium]
MFDEKFIEDNLAKVLGISHIPENRKKAVIEAMQKHIQSQVAVKVMSQLNMKDKMKLMPLMIKRNPEEIMKFMMEKVPGLPDIIQNEIKNFRPQALQIINS